ncbi:MAG: alpha-amylase family glycosyl hydrolase [Bacteroidia bacterium]
MKLKLLRACFCLSMCSINICHAQDFMLQGWYWDYPKTSQGAFWVDTINVRAKEWSDAGFTMIWCPPMSASASGNGSNGYDIRDLFNVGGPGLGNTGFGNKPKIQNMITTFNQYNLKAIGDMVYNHRNGGTPEDNTPVGGWIKNYNLTKHNNGDGAFPSDRFRCTMTIGGTTGRGAGTYYFRIRSASQSADYYNKPYKFYVRTGRISSNPIGSVTETANNGGGLCGQGSDSIGLAQNVVATIDNGGCGIDEFKVVMDTTMFYAVGDKFYITMVNDNGDYSDHYIYSLYYDVNGAELKDTVIYQTNTNFGNMASGRGQMNYECFKPNGNPTCLCGDWDTPFFFYDQAVTNTRDTLFTWTRWMWDSVGVQGYRADAVKNYSYQFTAELLNNLNSNGINPPMFVGEFYDYNPASLKGWIDNVTANMTVAAQQNIKPRVFDFALQGSLKEACDNIGSYDTRNIFQSGMVDGAGANGYNVVTFVNNHDFRTAAQACDIDPILAYTYLLTNNSVGMPCVYYPDYYLNTYKAQIDYLMDLHRKFIYQTAFKEYLNRFSTPFSSNYISGSADKCLIYQLSGGGGFSCYPNKDVIVAINYGNTTLKVDQQINAGSPFHSTVGDTLLDVLGNSNFPYAIVNGSGQMYIELPPRSYSAWINLPQPVTPAKLYQAPLTFAKAIL